MNVVFLNPVGVVGGAERILIASIQAVRTRFPEAAITAVLLGDGPLGERLRSLGIDVSILPLPRKLAGMGDSKLRTGGRLGRIARFTSTSIFAVPSALLYLRKLDKLLRAFDPVLIHSNGLKTHLFASLARSRGVPILWHLHDYYSHRAIAAKVLGRLRARCAAAIAVSESVKRDAESIFPGLPITTIFNPVDTAAFSPADRDSAELDRLAGLPPPPGPVLRIGLVATYAHWKGHDVFLKAAALLKSKAYAWRAYIVGGPIYATAGSQFQLGDLKRLAGELGIAERVGFIPFQADPADVYRMLDIVVHASTRPEPFGLTIAEAMSCGRPVVVARAGGAAELFAEGFDALAHTPGDAADLAGKIGSLADDPALRERVGTNARKTAEAQFSANRYSEELSEFYRKTLPGKFAGLGRRI